MQIERKKAKPPPIYVQNVKNIYELTTALNSLEETRYELKVRSTNEIKYSH